MAAVPFESAGITAWPSRTAWDAAALEIVGDVIDRWRLEVVLAYDEGIAASVLSVVTPEGTPAVLKVGFPHVESAYEAVALEAYGPELAPRVLRQDAWTWAMLLEPVAPGVPLSRSPLSTDDAIAAGCAVHTRIAARPVPPGIPGLAHQQGTFAREARDRLAGDRGTLQSLDGLALVERALDELDALLAETPQPAFLHGDFNPGNLLSSGDGWKVIDPNPLVGDPAFDLWPLITQLGDPLGARDALERGSLRVDHDALLHAVEFAALHTGYEARRLARWALARTGLNVSWYLQDGDHARAALEIEALDAWRRQLGY